TTPPTTTSPATTTTAAGGTTTTVPRDDDCHARPGERHGHPHSERCREPKHDQPPHHRYMRMRIWMW
ncbi:MAG: hypothetical protein ACXWBO_12345, partial [Ilumatobacteraceae bacterium]